MGSTSTAKAGPDLLLGVDERDLHDDVPLLGHAGDDNIVLIKSAGEVYALSATCTHYGGPLAEGLVRGGAIHCPLHHACFDLRTGRAKAPALNDLPCWDVERAGGVVRISKKRGGPARGKPSRSPSSIVLLGSGAASAACAETLRAEGYDGPITMVGEEPPVDRPNVSKDFLAGTAPDEWMPLRPLDFYRDARIEYVPATATSIDTTKRELSTSAGNYAYEAMLIATGAEPFVLPIEGARSPHVLTVRTLADAQKIITRGARRAVIIGASFIGLESAASLRARGADVSVVGMESVPLERVLGGELGRFVRALHESHGVRFHLGRKPVSIEKDKVVLDDGTELPSDLVIMGTGVRPRVALAQAAGAKLDNGIVVDDRLRTSLPGIYAAGDVARYPYKGGLVRIEHWVHAERQGQHAARVMLGLDAPFSDVPFFWSAHYDVTIRYVGHSEKPDAIELDGNLDARDAIVRFTEGGKLAAVATVGRDRAALEAAVELA